MGLRVEVHEGGAGEVEEARMVRQLEVAEEGAASAEAAEQLGGSEGEHRAEGEADDEDFQRGSPLHGCRESRVRRPWGGGARGTKSRRANIAVRVRVPMRNIVAPPIRCERGTRRECRRTLRR